MSTQNKANQAKKTQQTKSSASSVAVSTTKRDQTATAAVKASAPVVEASGNYNGENWMANKNPYLQSLRDPFGVSGARIPDGTYTQSAPFQVVYRTEIVSNNNVGNVAGMLFGYCGQSSNKGVYIIPQAGVVSTIGGSGAGGAMWLQTTANATGGGSSGQVFLDGTTAATGSAALGVVGLDGFFSAYVAKARVVSMALTIRPAVAATANAGMLIGGSLPSKFFDAQSMLNTMSTTQLENYPGAVRVSCNETLNGGGLTVTYNPQQPVNRNYSVTDFTSLPTTDPAWESVNPGILYVVAYGGGAQNLVYLVDLAINYEIIPQSGAFAFNIRPTVNDPLALAGAQNARATDPVVYAGSVMSQISAGEASGEGVSGDMMRSMVRFAGGSQTTDLPRFLPVRESLCLHSSRIVRHIPMRSQGKKFIRATKAVESEEEPLFESLIDDVASIGKKVLPKLASFLPIVGKFFD